MGREPCPAGTGACVQTHVRVHPCSGSMRAAFPRGQQQPGGGRASGESGSTKVHVGQNDTSKTAAGCGAGGGEARPGPAHSTQQWV